MGKVASSQQLHIKLSWNVIAVFLKARPALSGRAGELSLKERHYVKLFLKTNPKPTVSPLLTPFASRNLLLLQSLPNSIPYRQANVRRRKDDTVWAQRREELLSDCLVSPAVFHQMVDRLGEFVVPYQQALETEASQRNVHRYLQGLLSHLPGKNAEDIATFVDVERQVIQDFIGTAPWDHRPLVKVLVGQVAERLGEPEGIIAFDPSSFPKRGTHSVGVKRQWCGHRGKVDNCQVGVFMGYVSRHDHALLDFRLSLPEEWARDEQRRQACHVPPGGAISYAPRAVLGDARSVGGSGPTRLGDRG